MPYLLAYILLVLKMKKTLFIKNAAILTVSSLILRFAGILFKIWLASAVGAEGIGLYQLVFSVYVLAATFATSGISTAVTRLVADELAVGSARGTLKILKRSIQITLLVAIASVAILILGADFISGSLLGDSRASLSIKILSLSLPFMGVSSCLRGYFIARRKTGPAASSQILEQIIRILIVIFAVKRFSHLGIAAACAAVLLGDTVAEGLSCLYMYLRFTFDKRALSSLSGRARPPFAVVRAVLRISVPITAGRYLNSGLRTAENILVPKCLSKCHTDGDALSLFGMIKGMALPVLFFPSTLLNSLSTLLIPEISEAKALGRGGVVRSVTRQILKVTSILSFIFAAIFLAAGNKIGLLLYKSREVGFLLTALSPIVPLMYLDSVCDGLLKGLDQQLFTFRTAIFDSLLRIALVLAVLPRWGIYGFIGIMYFSNLLTCLLNVRRLLKVSGARIGFTQNILMPLIIALLVTMLSNCLLSVAPTLPNLVYIILLCVVSISLYIVLLFAFGIVDLDDVRGLVK